MPVEAGPQVIVVSARRPDSHSGKLTIPAHTGEPGTTLVAFIGRAKIRRQWLIGPRRIELVHTQVVSALHPLASSHAEGLFDNVHDGDIVAEFGDIESMNRANQQLRRANTTVNCIQRDGNRITSVELAAAGMQEAGISVLNV